MLAALAIGLGQFQNKARNGGHSDLLTVGVRGLLSPGVRMFDDVNQTWLAQWTAFSNGPKLKAELDRLRKIEVAERLYNQTVFELQRELSQIRTLHNLPNFGRQHVSARIIGYFPNENRFTMSVGADQGLSVGMPVVNWQGLLGIVQTVDKDSSQAYMICRPTVQFGGMVERDPEVVGLMKGSTPTRLILDILDNGKVEVGDPVVTSGLSDRIPRGIPVGTVADVVLDPSFGTRRVFVAPAAQIGPTLEVTVIK